MMSVMDPPLNARVALRYSLAMFPISIAACAIGMNSWIFLPLSTTVNSFMAYRAFNFYKQSGSQNARKLFFASLIHLPVFLLLLLATKIS